MINHFHNIYLNTPVALCTVHTLVIRNVFKRSLNILLKGGVMSEFEVGDESVHLRFCAPVNLTDHVFAKQF